MTIKVKTVDDVEVEIDESDLPDDLIEAEAIARGLTPREMLIGDYDTEELQDELDARGVGGDRIESVLADPQMVSWLRAADPPQAVRDAFFHTYGRILL